MYNIARRFLCLPKTHGHHKHFRHTEHAACVWRSHYDLKIECSVERDHKTVKSFTNVSDDKYESIFLLIKMLNTSMKVEGDLDAI